MSARRLTDRAWLCFGLIVGAATLLSLPPAHGEDGNALVIVNGRPISRKAVVDMLMETRGLEIMQQMITLELAKQETRRRGLKVTEADVQEQLRRAINEIVPTTDANDAPLTDEGQRQALLTVLHQRCLTMPEFELAMRRNAHLRKAIEVDFTVSEKTLREEFARTHGEKVEVRHIQVAANDTRALHEALDLLGRNVDFAQVARQVSANPVTAANGGLMEPFTFTAPDEEVPAALREVAFSLAPGEVSAPTLTGKMIHILKLERRISPAGVRFENVRADVERRLRDRVVRQKMNEMITRLFAEARIRVLDPKLKREFEALLQDFSSGTRATP